MEYKIAIEILNNYVKWRKDGEILRLKPKKVKKALNIVLADNDIKNNKLKEQRIFKNMLVPKAQIVI